MDTLGQRLMVSVVDSVARDTPDKVFSVWPRPETDLDDPHIWQDMTYGEAARAIDHLAHMLAALPVMADHTAGTFPTVAYSGPNDVRYVFFMLAANKAGAQALFVSGRNTTAGQASLFAQTDCRVLFVAAAHRALGEEWVVPGMTLTVLPETEALLAASATAKPFPFDKTFAEACNDPLAVLHTSGTTGLPKAVVVRHGMWAALDGYQDRTRYPETAWSVMRQMMPRALVVMPLFHTAGLVLAAVLAVYVGTVVVYPPTDRSLLEPGRMAAVLRRAAVDGTMLPPFMVEQLAASEEGMAAMKELKLLISGGGSLAKSTGDYLVENGVSFHNMVASTESLPYALGFQHNTALWDYFIVLDHLNGSQFRRLAGSDDDNTPGGALHELVYVRETAGPLQPGDTRSAFWTFPHLTEWSTRDLYQRHPTLPDHWRFYSRVDSLVVFSNGEKLNPEDLESALTGHPAIAGALVVGSGRFQAALLVEPTGTVADDEAFIRDTVWPLVQTANAATVAHGRIARSLIALADPVAKPFPRAGKGTVQRALAAALYADEIDALYSRSETAVALDPSSPETLARGICNLLVDRLDVSPLLAPDADFFSGIGLDSLQVMNAVRLLQAGLVAKEGLGARISLRAIYAHPTPLQLAAFLLSDDDDDEDDASEIQAMQALIDAHTVLPDCPRSVRPPPRSVDQTVLVTGTTGSLGAYLLNDLLHRPSVSRVIALNRDHDGGAARQAAAARAKGLDTADWSRVTFLHADLSQPGLGLGHDDAIAAQLADVDCVLHCAWPVHFHHGVAAFAPSIAGIRHLALHLATRTVRRAPLVFVSSVSAALHPPTPGPVPEEPVPDLHAAAMGYGRAKLVASRVLDVLGPALGVPVVHVRLGQVAGPRDGGPGLWNPHELLPSIFASSVHLGAVPQSLGAAEPVDWITAEDAAGTLVDMAIGHHHNSSSSVYLHCINPHPVPWGDLLPAFHAVYGHDIQALPFPLWVARLADTDTATTASLHANPALKLLDRLRQLAHPAAPSVPSFALARSLAASPTLAAAAPVAPALFEKWCRQWDFGN